MTGRTRTLALTATAVVLAITAVAVWLIVRPTYDDKVSACLKAIRAEWGDGTKLADNRPADCADIKEDDYTKILVVVAADKSGVSDMLDVD